MIMFRWMFYHLNSIVYQSGNIQNLFVVEFNIVLKLINVSKKYKKRLVVDNMSFEIFGGDVLGLLGSNGAGKSTTLSMIATLLKPNSGQILLDDVDILKQQKKIRKEIGYVPQEIALYENLTGNDNLSFFAKAYHLSGKIMKDRLKYVKNILGLTEEQLQEKVCCYSGGMKRRLNMGVALLHDPKLLLLDEPTVGVDIESRDRILDTIESLSKKGTMVIYIGHYMEEVAQICNKICIMNQGSRIVFGEIQELLEQENESLEEFYKRHL